MKNISIKPLAALLFVLCLSSCGGGSDDGPSNPPVTEADISGGVNLFDDKNIPELNDGMTVTVEGRSESGITDDQGRFRITGVPFGTYRLVYEKAGYGTFKGPEFVHEENDDGITFIPDSPSLGQISTTTITSATAALDGNDFLLTIETEPVSNNANPLFITVFLKGSPDVSNLDNSAVHGPRQIQINPVDIRITRDQLTEYGFSSDETVYMRVYGESQFTNAYEEFGSTIHPNANPTASSVLELVVQ